MFVFKVQVSTVDRLVVCDAVAREVELLHSFLDLLPDLVGVPGLRVQGECRPYRWYPQRGQVSLMAQVSPEPEVQLGDDLAIDLGPMTPVARPRALPMAWAVTASAPSVSLMQRCLSTRNWWLTTRSRRSARGWGCMVVMASGPGWDRNCPHQFGGPLLCPLGPSGARLGG